jgi:hypothetical protein
MESLHSHGFELNAITAAIDRMFLHSLQRLNILACDVRTNPDTSIVIRQQVKLDGDGAFLHFQVSAKQSPWIRMGHSINIPKKENKLECIFTFFSVNYVMKNCNINAG